MSGYLLDDLRAPSPMETESLERRTVRLRNMEITKPEIYIRFEYKWFRWRWNAYVGNKFLHGEEELENLLANLVAKDLLSNGDAVQLLENISG